MSNYWAIAIGINHYQHLQPLHFAQQDAQSLCESLVADAGFLPDRQQIIFSVYTNAIAAKKAPQAVFGLNVLFEKRCPMQ